jgi:hypothetical protein
MSLPKDFWEEFERRLDARLDNRFAQLRSELDYRFARIDDRFAIIDDRFARIDGRFAIIDGTLSKLDDKIKQVIKWTKRQDHSIERELELATRDHLQMNYPGYITVIPAKAVLGRVVKDKKNGLTITDFDGVVVLTNDKKYADVLSGKIISEEYSPEPGSKSYLVIVEAKEHLTLAKVEKKKQQRFSIQEVIKGLPHLKYVDPFIGLYMGGIDIDEAADKEIRAFVEANKKNELIGTIELNGHRFSVKDMKNDHGNSSMVYGGKRAK